MPAPNTATTEYARAVRLRKYAARDPDIRRLVDEHAALLAENEELKARLKESGREEPESAPAKAKSRK